MPTGIYRHKPCSEKTKHKISLRNSGSNNGQWKGGKVKKICQTCGKMFLSDRWFKNAQFCSWKCYKKSRFGKIGKDAKGWKGGRIKNAEGYIRISCPGHPYATKRGFYVLLHRFVMEKHLGRYLKPHEIVHHINENRSDNRLENLMLFPNRAAHGSFHAKQP